MGALKLENIRKIIAEAEGEAEYIELKDLLRDFEADKDLIKFLVRFCKWVELDSKALWEKIEELDEVMDERIENRLRRHRHLPDGTPVEAI